MPVADGRPQKTNASLTVQAAGGSLVPRLSVLLWHMRTGNQDDLVMNQSITQFRHALRILIIQTGGPVY